MAMNAALNSRSLGRASTPLHATQQHATTSRCRTLLEQMPVRSRRSCRLQSTGVSSQQQPATSQQQPMSEHKIGFPFGDLLDVDDGRQLDAETVIKMLTPFLYDGRVERIQQVAKERTFAVLPIVEGLYDMGNLAAVCRSADAMGFGAVHCINTRIERYKQSARTSAGADKWLDVKVWNSGTKEALTAIKQAGYQVVVTHLSKSSITIQEVDWSKPTAFVLGNEKSGVSDEAVAMADHCAIIPMAGFVESFNISVAAALVMYEANQQRQRKLGRNGDLTEAQQKIMQATYMMRSVREGPSVIKELLSRPPQSWQSNELKKKLGFEQ